jgi:hypothetical protein
MADFFEASRYIRFTVRGNEQAFTPLPEVVSFLYDFNLLYEISRLAIDPIYDSFRFTPSVVYRTGRPLEDSDRLHLETIKLGSPIEQTTILAALPVAAATIWVMLQSANLIVNWPLNRRKLRAEVEKIELENAERRSVPPQQVEPPAIHEIDSIPSRAMSIEELLEKPELVERRLERREALTIYQRVGKRLARSTIQLTEVEIERIERLPRGDEDQ